MRPSNDRWEPIELIEEQRKKIVELERRLAELEARKLANRAERVAKRLFELVLGAWMFVWCLLTAGQIAVSCSDSLRGLPSYAVYQIDTRCFKVGAVLFLFWLPFLAIYERLHEEERKYFGWLWGDRHNRNT